MVNGETYILGTEDNTSHTKQVWRAITASPGRFLSWLLFHCSSRARGCANKKWIVGACILNFEKRAWRPYKEKKKGEKRGEQSKKERKKNRETICFPTRFQNQDRPIYFSSPKIIFIRPLCILIFKKLSKNKTKKTLRD